MVDLLARHLYSGPRVFLRELLQNAVDAVAARTVADPDAPRHVRIEVTASGLDVVDTGIGLTKDEAAELLSTIGRSSKRSDEMLARTDYIGRFGIGMLASFMVAETIEVFSRSARPGAAVVHWQGHDDGRFDIDELTEPLGDLDPAALPVGTLVRLRARSDAKHWFEPQTITALATEFGELLPVPVDVIVPVGDTVAPRRITRDALPWQKTYASPRERDAALVAYAEETLGFTPLGMIDLAVPAAGLTGTAFILPAPVSPGRAHHRVYVKRMLLGDRVDGVLPDWAFFLRAVVNADDLNPTASREQLHTDEVLVTAQEQLSVRLRDWAKRTLTEPGPFLNRFLQTHHLALRALAVTDDELLDVVTRVLPYQTTRGVMTLNEVAQAQDEILYTTTTGAYRRVADVAAAQDLIVVNAGYVYDADIMARASGRGWSARELSADDLLSALRPVDPSRELEVLDALLAVGDALREADCEVQLREFDPDSVPALLLRDAEAEHQRALSTEREIAVSPWAAALAAFETSKKSRRLVLNDTSALTRRLLASRPGEVFDAGVQAIYLSSVLRSGESLGAAESDALNDALDTLLAAGLRAEDDAGRAGEDGGSHG